MAEKGEVPRIITDGRGTEKIVGTVVNNVNDRQAELDAKIANAEAYAAQIMSITSSINTIIQNGAKADLKTLDDELKQKQAKLKADYETGIISKEQYETQLSSLEADTAKKSEEIKKDADLGESNQPEKKVYESIQKDIDKEDNSETIISDRDEDYIIKIYKR